MNTNRLSSNETFRAAIGFASKGFHVFPVLDPICKRVPTSSSSHPKAHPALVSKASTNWEQLEDWWRERPEANVAIATGALSGLIVVTFSGTNCLEMLYNYSSIDKNPDYIDTLSVDAGDERHFYFSHPGFTVPSCTAIAPDIYVIGDGGFVLAPPSRIEPGVYCTFDDPNEPIMSPPAWLLRELYATERRSA